jgi:large subunit ribosomal protein L5
LSVEDEEQDKQAESPVADQPEAEVPAEAKPRRTRNTPAKSGAASPRARTPKAKAAAPDAAAVDAPAAEATATDEAAPAAAAPKRQARKKVEPRAFSRLMTRYREEIKGQLQREFEYSSSMQVPQVTKVVVNVGLGEALTNARSMETTPEHVAMISGQRPVITKARTSIANFKLREGQAIGVKVTLRGRRMYDFLDRLISMGLPRIRDFRGVSRTAFDGNGNYALGLREQIMFPEIEYGSVDRVRGLQVTITTSARTDPEGYRLLELMGMPFAREGQTR